MQPEVTPQEYSQGQAGLTQAAIALEAAGWRILGGGGDHIWLVSPEEAEVELASPAEPYEES
jgi:hypothetical protein